MALCAPVWSVSPEEVCVNPMISYTDSCNGSDSSDIELTDEWVGKKSPKLSRGNRSPKLFRSKNIFIFTLRACSRLFYPKRLAIST